MSQEQARAGTPVKPREKPPECTRMKSTDKGGRAKCHNPGFACWVTGEFGRAAHTLCMPCIAQLRAMGWVVRYQIEGDNPAAVE